MIAAWRNYGALKKPMPQVTSSEIETLLRALALISLLLYLAPAAFGPNARWGRAWLHRAAAATLVVAFIVALAASVRWFLR